MEFALRPSTGSDLAAVDAVLARSYPRLLKHDYPPSVLVTVLPLISRARPALMSCGTFYVAETPDGCILGAGGITRDRTRTDIGHVRHVATDPDHTRRHGIAAAILRHALMRARDSGLALIECWATRTAVPFYRAQGFVETGPIEVPLAPGISFPAVRMTQSLSSAVFCR